MSYRSLAAAIVLSAGLQLSGCADSESDESSPLADAANGDEDGEFGLRFEVSEVAVGVDRIRFEAGGSALELALVPNRDLLEPGAVVVRDGEVLTPAEAGLDLPYRGYVVGDAKSWIRVRLTDSGFEGLIHTNDGLWEVRESEEGGVWMTHSSIADYIDTPTSSARTCATSDAEAAYGSYALLDDPAPAKAGCQQISIALVSDYTHVQALGGAANSESEMLARLNETDGIYQADLNYAFSVGEIRSFSASGGPSFNSAGAGNLPLDQFASYKQSELAEWGLAHLFLARTDSGTVGLAFIASLCTASKATSVSNYLGKSKVSTVIVAHEIGHNFGAPHDSSNAPYIMAPSVEPDMTTFSDTSHSKIAAHVASVSCFTPCADQPDPDPSPDPDPDPSPDPDPDPSPDPDPVPTPDASCDGACGGQSPGGCWCDEQCEGYGDCCGDFEQVCTDPDPEPKPKPKPKPNGKASCAGSCGGQSPAGCWCDDACEGYGDCCKDLEQVCG